jgi:hypothetical protein
MFLGLYAFLVCWAIGFVVIRRTSARKDAIAVEQLQHMGETETALRRDMSHLVFWLTDVYGAFLVGTFGALLACVLDLLVRHWNVW